MGPHREIEAKLEVPPGAAVPDLAGLPGSLRSTPRLASALKRLRRDQLLREAHKAAKCARFAAEAVVPVVGRPAEKFARAAKDVQTLLGHHQDLVELGTVLQCVGAQAHLDGEDTFTYGRLHAIEQARAQRIEDRLPAA